MQLDFSKERPALFEQECQQAFCSRNLHIRKNPPMLQYGNMVFSIVKSGYSFVLYFEVSINFRSPILTKI